MEQKSRVRFDSSSPNTPIAIKAFQVPVHSHAGKVAECQMQTSVPPKNTFDWQEGRTELDAACFLSSNTSIGTWHQLKIPNRENRFCQLSCMSSWRSVTVVTTNLLLHKYQTVLENKHLFGTRIKWGQHKSTQEAFLETSEFPNLINTINSYYAEGTNLGEKDAKKQAPSKINWIPAH